VGVQFLDRLLHFAEAKGIPQEWLFFLLGAGGLALGAWAWFGDSPHPLARDLRQEGGGVWIALAALFFLTLVLGRR
jgi:hypothetical protein